MQRTMTVVFFSVVLLTLVGASAYGQVSGHAPAQTVSQDTSSQATSKDTWEFLVAPYFWAVQIHSNVTVKGYTAHETTTFSDIWNHLNAGALAHFEATKGGKWGFFFDTIYLKLHGDTDVPTLRNTGLAPPGARDVTLTTETWIVEGGGFYRLGRWPMEGKPGQAVTVDAIGGLRYWYMDMNLDTSSPVNPSDHDQWVDPFIGARAQVDLTKQLWFFLRGDVGGFGVGSDFSWNGMALFGYQFTPKLTGMLGYRAMYVNYKKSSGSARYEETFYGPIAGVSYVF